MRIAVVGGGAAGLVSAWLLGGSHDVVVYERAPTVGGHVRTLGGNVPAVGPYRLDAGVIELERAHFPTVFAALGALGVGLRAVPGTTTFFPREGRRWWSPGALSDADAPLWERGLDLLRLELHRGAAARFREQAHRAVVGERLGALLGDDIIDRWLALLVMYAYSTPLAEVPDVAAELAVPMLDRFLDAEAWFSVEGGMYAYQEAILSRFSGTVYTNAQVRARRSPDGVTVTHEDGSTARYDALVVATPPHRVLDVLADADEAERARFGACRGRTVEVCVHDDPGPYVRRGATVGPDAFEASEFDVFELDGGDGAYNARLDRLCGLPHGLQRTPGLAFHLDAEIDPARVLWRQTHDVGVYDVAGMAHRGEVLATQGHRATWYAGAWLGDGLHEGAFASAVEVARALGAPPRW